MLIELWKISHLSLKVCFKIESPILFPEWACIHPKGIFCAQTTSTTVCPFRKSSVSAQQIQTSFSSAVWRSASKQIIHTILTYCVKKTSKIVIILPARKVPFLLPKGSWKHSLQPKSSSCQRLSTRFAVPEWLHPPPGTQKLSHAPAGAKITHCLQHPRRGTRLDATLTSIQDIFPWKSPSLPSWCWLSASHWVSPAQHLLIAEAIP